MKTKFSTRVISLLLSVLMLVTSMPIVSLTADAASFGESNSSYDESNPDVKEIIDAMDDFDEKLQRPNASWANVTPAYTAYVNCQKALDAFTYGKCYDALTGKADALTQAMTQMVPFTPAHANATPSFAGDSSSPAMTSFKETGYRNLLYSPQAVTQGDSANPAGDIYVRITYANTVALYTGLENDEPLVPVMASAYAAGTKNGYEKSRYIFSFFPVSAIGTNNDHPLAQLNGYWKANGGGGDTADWTWNMNPAATLHTIGYNSSTGVSGTIGSSNTYKTSRIPQCTRSGSFWSYKYDVNYNQVYMANSLKILGLSDSTKYSETIKPYWRTATGGSYDGPDMNSIDPGSGITVVNYSLLLNKLQTAGTSMKAINPRQYSEGGLDTYIARMDAATSFNPSSYYTNGDGTTTLTSDMSTICRNLESAPGTATANSAKFKELRDGVTRAMINTLRGGGDAYTEDSWNRFEEACQASIDIWAGVLQDGYTTTLANRCHNVALELAAAFAALDEAGETTRANTEALVAAISQFENFDNIFTTATYQNAVSAVNTAKATVWGSADDYGVPTSVQFTEDEQASVDAQTALVNAAIAALRISKDYKVSTPAGFYSLNEVLAFTVADPSEWANYGAFQAAQGTASDYSGVMDRTDLTNYATQLNAYKNQVIAVSNAYFGLRQSFMKLPNGTAVDTGATTSINQLEDSKNSNKYNFRFNFTYPSTGTVIMTQHQAANNVVYGKAELEHSINIDNNTSKENNGIDSITLDAQADNNVNITEKSGTSTPSDIGDGNRATYAAGLKVGSFGITNFRFKEQENNCKDFIAVDNDGNRITDKNADLTPIFATTNGNNSNPAKGCTTIQPGKKGDSKLRFSADMTVDVPAPAQSDLSREAGPTSSTITFENHYFGVTYVWNTQPQLAWAGYGYMKGDALYSQVTVIDATPLFDLVRKYEAEFDSNMYTSTSWAKFDKKMQAAKDDLSIETLTASTVLSRLQTRYTELWDSAHNDLVKKTFNFNFNYKDANGADQTYTVQAFYGDTLQQYKAGIDALAKPDYVEGIYTYHFSHWDPDYNNDLDKVIKTTGASYTAVYTRTVNKADFEGDNYNNAKTAILNEIDDEIYTIEDLNALNDALAQLEFFNMTEAQKAEVLADRQEDITTEKETLDTLKTEFVAKANKVDISVSIAQAEGYTSEDEDRYDVSGAFFTRDQFLEETTVAGVPVVGIKYPTQTASDKVVKDAMEAKVLVNYTIQYTAPDGKVYTEEDVPYGTPVIVDMDGTITLGVNDTHTNANLNTVAWTYSYSAPSTNNKPTPAKFATKAPSYGFIVKGDTFLTATQPNTGSTAGYQVTFIADTVSRKAFDVIYTDAQGNFTMPTAPKYAYYNFDSYSNGLAQGASAQVSADTVIVAKYNADKSNTYVISYFDSKEAWDDAVPTQEFTNLNYNDTLTLTNDDAYCWVTAIYDDLSTYQILAYGTTYKFCVCRSYANDDYEGIVALTETEYKSILRDGKVDAIITGDGEILKATQVDAGVYEYPELQPSVSVLEHAVPVYSGDTLEKVSLVGTFSVPTGYKVVEYGFLFSNVAGADLSVDNVGNQGVARFKCSKFTPGNQFVVNVRNSGTFTSFDYCAYAVVEKGGDQTVVYSAIKNDSIRNY